MVVFDRDGRIAAGEIEVGGRDRGAVGEFELGGQLLALAAFGLAPLASSARRRRRRRPGPDRWSGARLGRDRLVGAARTQGEGGNGEEGSDCDDLLRTRGAEEGMRTRGAEEGMRTRGARRAKHAVSLAGDRHDHARWLLGQFGRPAVPPGAWSSWPTSSAASRSPGASLKNTVVAVTSVEGEVAGLGDVPAGIPQPGRGALGGALGLRDVVDPHIGLAAGAGDADVVDGRRGGGHGGDRRLVGVWSRRPSPSPGTRPAGTPRPGTAAPSPWRAGAARRSLVGSLTPTVSSGACADRESLR